MKIYLAARYGRRDQLRRVRKHFEYLGHEVTSRWLDTEWTTGEGRSSTVASPEERVKYCLMDMEDVMRSDAVVSFTETPDDTAGKRGGRHVEFGMALATGKRVIVVGFHENIFHHHPSVEFVQDECDLIGLFGG